MPGLWVPSDASSLPWGQHPSALLRGVQLVLLETSPSPPELEMSLLFPGDTRSEVHLQTVEGVRSLLFSVLAASLGLV